MAENWGTTDPCLSCCSVFTEVKLWPNAPSLTIPPALLLPILCSASALKQSYQETSGAIHPGGKKKARGCLHLSPGGKTNLNERCIITLTVSDLDHEKLDRKSSLVSRNLRSVFCFSPPAKYAGFNQPGLHMQMMCQSPAMGIRPGEEDRVKQQKPSSNHKL